MTATGKVIVWTVVLLFALPTGALPQSRYRSEEGRKFAYRVRYDAGYRDGQRQGSTDYRFHRRYNYRTREYNQADR